MYEPFSSCMNSLFLLVLSEVKLHNLKVEVVLDYCHGDYIVCQMLMLRFKTTSLTSFVACESVVGVLITI